MGGSWVEPHSGMKDGPDGLRWAAWASRWPVPLLRPLHVTLEKWDVVERRPVLHGQIMATFLGKTALGPEDRDILMASQWSLEAGWASGPHIPADTSDWLPEK